MRHDLLALSDDALIELANKGTVRSAHKRMERGGGPELQVEADGTIIATFGDGTVSTLPPGVPLRDAPCTCPATRLCRHRVMAVLAFRALAPDDAGPGEEAPLPALDIPDEVLQKRLGKRLFTKARKDWSMGFEALARVGRPTEVQLPTCTVRFLVPWDLAHVRCDCKQGVDCEHVALAVWTLQRVDPLEGETRIEVAGQTRSDDQDLLRDLLGLQRDLVQQGWTGAFDALRVRMAGLVKRLEKARCVWLVDVVEELERAIGEYEGGVSTADPEVVGGLIGELGLRAAVVPSEEAPRSALHGALPSGSTDLDRVTLTGIGARYRRLGARGALDVFFVDADLDQAFVLRRTYQGAEEGADAPSGPELARRRLAGQSVGMLALATRTTDRATRRPNREILLGVERGVSASGGVGRGGRLHQGARSLGELRQRFASRAPASLRARVKTSDIVLTGFSVVEEMGWDPGRQTVWAIVSDGEETEQALVRSEWRAETPGAPAVLAEALLAAQQGLSVVLSAEAQLHDGRLVLEPLALVTDGRVSCPDLAPDRVIAELPVDAVPLIEGRLKRTLSGAQSQLAQMLVRGLAHRTPLQRQACTSRAEELRELGLTGTADAWTALGAATEPDEAVDAWRRAWAWGVGLAHRMATVE